MAGWITISLGTMVGLGPGHIVLDGDPALPKKGTAPPNFRSMSIVAKRSPISAAAEHLLKTITDGECTVYVHSIIRNINDSVIVATWHAETSCRPLLFACARVCVCVCVGHAVNEIDELWQQTSRRRSFRTGRNLAT